MDLLKANLQKHTQTLIDDLIDKDILPTITCPTRIKQSTATLIDNIFVTEKLHHFLNLQYYSLTSQITYQPLLC